jgi:hypothetical protein
MLSLLFTLFSVTYSQPVNFVTLIDLKVSNYTDPYDNIYTQRPTICAYRDVIYGGCVNDQNMPSLNGRNINVIVKVNTVSIDSFVYNYMRADTRNLRDYDMWFNILIMAIKSIDKFTGFGDGNIFRHYVLTDSMQILSYMTRADAYIVNTSISYINKPAVY